MHFVDINRKYLRKGNRPKGRASNLVSETMEMFEQVRTLTVKKKLKITFLTHFVDRDFRN
jgi:hypothetical protein